MNGSGATSGCAAVSDRLPELALGILSGTERADVLDHLDSCPSCRAESGEWAATVDVLPSLLAEAEPPAGFEARTLERLRADQARVPRRSLTQRIFALAAVVAFVMVASIAAVRIIDARELELVVNRCGVGEHDRARRASRRRRVRHVGRRAVRVPRR